MQVATRTPSSSPTNPPENLWQFDSWQLADAIRQGSLSASKVLDEAIQRIETLNPSINAVVASDYERARRAAESIDSAIASGRDPGGLAGVPILVKDLEDAEGLPTTRGSLLFKDFIATNDSTHVARVKRAGAIVIGKSATPEFGSTFFTRSKIHGITRNPWNLDRSPGGSSGGSAAAVAAGIVPLGTASDGGGSTRIPASFCGLVGHKPTRGLIPHGPGYFSISHASVLGCLARCVRDVARHLDVTAGPSPLDPDTYPVQPEFEARLEIDLPKGLRAGWSETMGFGVCDPDVARIARKAAEAACEATSLELIEVDVPFKDPAKAWSILGSVELAYELQPYLPDRYEDLTPPVQLSIEMTKTLKLEDVGRALERVSQLVEAQARLFENVDFLFTPTTATTAIPAEGSIPNDIAGKRVGPFGVIPFTYPFNLTGNPAISVPAGVDSNGLPVGVQIAGPRFSDGTLLQIAYRYEQANPWPKFAPLAYQ
ncbi:MAG: amidase [Acidimicrobiia bacterium]